VCIAAYNEERTIGSLVKGLVDIGLTNVIVVDDGSKDGTALEARKGGGFVLSLSKNAGQWVALRNAFKIALDKGTRIIVTFDADGQHLPQTIPQLVRPVLRGTADISVASRFRETRFNGKHVRKLGISALNLFMWLMTKHRFTDCTSGLTAMRSSIVRKVLPSLSEPQFGRLEFWMMVASQSPRIIEVPILVKPNRFSSKGQFRFAANLVRTVVKSRLNMNVERAGIPI
jgi:glycosyltransferase involved in cell wall biosynthesis